MSELSREQVEHHADQINHCEPEYIADHVNILLAHDAALRQALAQQAQELDQAAMIRDENRATISKQAQEVERLQNGLETAYALHTDDDKRLFALEQQLSAMTTERDEAMGHAASMSNDVTHLGEQLAASQARCRELEDWKKIIIGSGTDQETVIRMAASEYTKTAVQGWKDYVAELQATLAAREVRIAELDQHANGSSGGSANHGAQS